MTSVEQITELDLLDRFLRIIPLSRLEYIATNEPAAQLVLDRLEAYAEQFRSYYHLALLGNFTEAMLLNIRSILFSIMNEALWLLHLEGELDSEDTRGLS